MRRTQYWDSINEMYSNVIHSNIQNPRDTIFDTDFFQNCRFSIRICCKLNMYVEVKESFIFVLNCFRPKINFTPISVTGKTL